MQVRKHYCKSYYSDNTCLIVLPCARQLCSCIYELASYLTESLLLAGNVDTNPELEIEEMLEVITSLMLELIAKDTKEIKKD